MSTQGEPPDADRPPELPELPPVLRRSNVFIVTTRDLWFLAGLAALAGFLLGRWLP